MSLTQRLGKRGRFAKVSIHRHPQVHYYEIMKQHLSQKDILRLLKADKAFLRNEFGVITIGLFGSYIKGTQHADSDIDLLVELKEPRFDWIAGLQMYLEKRFDKKIELVRKSDNVNRRFTQRIENEVLYA